MTTFTDRFRTNFDGNGSSFGDLVLFRDDGSVAIWLMNENQRIGSGTNLPNNGPTWHVRAAAEFGFPARHSAICSGKTTTARWPFGKCRATPPRGP
jgi:hypothetical protein